MKRFALIKTVIAVVALVISVINIAFLLLGPPTVDASEEGFVIDSCQIDFRACQVIGYSCVLGNGTCGPDSCGNISCNRRSGGPQ